MILRRALCAVIIYQMVLVSLPVCAEATVDIDRLSMMALFSPYSSEAISPYLKEVQRRRQELGATEQGRRHIHQASKMRLLAEMKNRLDKCFGGDIFRLGEARALFQAALGSDVVANCDVFASPLDDAQAFMRELDSALSGPPLDRLKTISEMNHEIFADTAVKAARYDARLSYLLKDPSDTSEIAGAVCGDKGASCPPELRATLTSAAQDERKRLANEGHNPMTADQASERLKGTRRLMDLQLYSQERSYHISHSSDPVLQQQWQNMSRPLRAPRNPETYEQLVGQLSNGILSRGRLPANVSPGSASDMARFERQVLSEIPQDFYRYQQQMDNDPVAQVLVRGDREWREALGAGVAPRVEMGMPPYFQVRLSQPPGGITPRAISAETIRKSRDNQMRQLRGAVRELGQEVFALNPTNAAIEETFRKLLVANPSGAAQALLSDPRRLSIFCESLKILSNNEARERYIQYGLVAAMIGGAILTGGGSLLGVGAIAAVGSATVAAAMVGETANSMLQIANLTEVASLQRVACYGQATTSDSCSAYESAMRSVTNQYLAAGFSAASLGPFARGFAAAAQGSVSRLTSNAANLSEALSTFASAQGQALRARLADQGASFVSQLSAATSAEVRELKALLSKMTPVQVDDFAAAASAELKGGAICVQ